MSGEAGREVVLVRTISEVLVISAMSPGLGGQMLCERVPFIQGAGQKGACAGRWTLDVLTWGLALACPSLLSAFSGKPVSGSEGPPSLLSLAALHTSPCFSGPGLYSKLSLPPLPKSFPRCGNLPAASPSASVHR